MGNREAASRQGPEAVWAPALRNLRGRRGEAAQGVPTPQGEGAVGWSGQGSQASSEPIPLPPHELSQG